MLDTSHNLGKCSIELGCPVEQLLTPLTRFKAQRPEREFSIDNGAFSGFNPIAFRALLARELPRRNLCRWVTAPDVVGSAIRTLEAFDQWCGELAGWPIAFVCQDGQENFPIPWRSIQAVFIGGSTDWKMGRHAEQIIRCAQIHEMWVHVGRVNTPGRFEHFEKLGVDSIDGTGLSRYSWMREAIWKRDLQMEMFAQAAQAECPTVEGSGRQGEGGKDV
jgi:hypothetical protein